MTKRNSHKIAFSHSSSPLTGEAYVPGDKSISHRALMLGALASGATRIRGMLESSDIMATSNAMQALGASIEKVNEEWIVNGVGNGCLLAPKAPLNFGNSGTGVRLTMGLAGAYDMETTFIGDTSLSSRPMGRVLQPLKQMGIQIKSDKDGYLPITLHGPKAIVPIDYHIPVPSAQVKSAILLASLRAKGIATITEPVITRDHSERMLINFGAKLEIQDDLKKGRTIRLHGMPQLKGQDINIPGDPSSAAFLMVAALIVPDSDILIKNVLINPLRNGIIITLKQMGGNISIFNYRDCCGEKMADLRVKHSVLKGLEIPASRAPSMIDEYPVLAIAATFAQGVTIMRGLEELRIKESDRLSAIAEGLKANKIECEAKDETLFIQGRGNHKIGGGMVHTHLDHRIAMSFLLLGLAANDRVEVDDITMIKTSFPDFIDVINGLGGKIEI